VVAMMIPIVQSWGRALGLKPSKLLMPLSFSSILGGTLTLIGTSTNLVVEGLAREVDPTLSLGLFEIAMVGAPQMVLGLIYIYIFSRWLLPVRETTQEKYKRNPRNYVVACRVKPRSPMVGVTIEDAGLRHLPGLYLVEIEREDGEVVAAPSAAHILHGNGMQCACVALGFAGEQLAVCCLALRGT
jgi:di/tricarboxylate transporter